MKTNKSELYQDGIIYFKTLLQSKGLTLKKNESINNFIRARFERKNPSDYNENTFNTFFLPNVSFGRPNMRWLCPRIMEYLFGEKPIEKTIYDPHLLSTIYRYETIDVIAEFEYVTHEPGKGLGFDLFYYSINLPSKRSSPIKQKRNTTTKQLSKTGQQYLDDLKNGIILALKQYPDKPANQIQGDWRYFIQRPTLHGSKMLLEAGKTTEQVYWQGNARARFRLRDSKNNVVGIGNKSIRASILHDLFNRGLIKKKSYSDNEDEYVLPDEKINEIIKQIKGKNNERRR